MATHSCVPSGVNSKHSYYNISGQTSAYTDENSTSYCQVGWTRGKNAETYIYFFFDCSPIPDNVTILSVTCRAKVYASQSSSSYTSSRTVQLRCNIGTGRGTVKSNAVSYSTTTGVKTMTGTSFTRDELRDTYVMMNVVRGSSNTSSSYYSRFYGATLTVTYEVNKVKYVFTSSVNGNGGNITPLGNVEVEEGNSQEYTVSADNGYKLDKVTVDGSAVTVTQNKLTVTADNNHNIIAYFLKLGTGLYLKRSGSWSEIQTIYRKENGSWVERSASDIFGSMHNGDKTPYVPG